MLSWDSLQMYTKISAEKTYRLLRRSPDKLREMALFCIDNRKHTKPSHLSNKENTSQHFGQHFDRRLGLRYCDNFDDCSDG